MRIDTDASGLAGSTQGLGHAILWGDARAGRGMEWAANTRSLHFKGRAAHEHSPYIYRRDNTFYQIRRSKKDANI